MVWIFGEALKKAGSERLILAVEEMESLEEALGLQKGEDLIVVFAPHEDDPLGFEQVVVIIQCEAVLLSRFLVGVVGQVCEVHLTTNFIHQIRT